MTKWMLCTLAAAALLGTSLAGESHAERRQWRAYRQSTSLPWHNAYYHTMYGEPIALVVPPTAEFQSQYGWGVGGTRTTPIYHQFTRPYPGPIGPGQGGFLPTPIWPSDTTQFGVYYIRGPW